MAGHWDRRYEVLVIATTAPTARRRLRRNWPAYPLSLHVRTASTAVERSGPHGMSLARGEIWRYGCRPAASAERLPDLLAPLTIMMRPHRLFCWLGYVPGESTARKMGLGDDFNSWIATLLAPPVRGADPDPMSGFFAMRRQTPPRRHLSRWLQGGLN